MIRILSGVENVDLDAATKNYLVNEGISNDETVIILPEYDPIFWGKHINKIVNYIREEVNAAIIEKRDLTIATFNSAVFDAARAEIHKLNDNNTTYYLVSFLHEDSDSYEVASINSRGQVTGWPNEIFNTTESLLRELLM